MKKPIASDQNFILLWVIMTSLFVVSLLCIGASHHSTQIRIDDMEARLAGMQPEVPHDIGIPPMHEPPISIEK